MLSRAPPSGSTFLPIRGIRLPPLPSFLPSRRAPCCSNGFVNGGRRATTLCRERARGPPADGLPPRTERQAADRRDGIDMLPASSPSVSAQLLFLSVVCQVVREWRWREASSQGILSRATCYTTKTFSPILKIVQQYGYSLDLRRNW